MSSEHINRGTENSTHENSTQENSTQKTQHIQLISVNTSIEFNFRIKQFLKCRKDTFS